MQNMRKYKTIITLTLILCFLTFQITKPRQAYAFAPAVGVAIAAVLAVGTAAGLTYTFDNATGDAIASRLQAFLDDVHPGQTIANYFSARNTAIKEGLMYIGASLLQRINEFFNWEMGANNLSAGSSVVVTSSPSRYYTLSDLSVSSIYSKRGSVVDNVIVSATATSDKYISSPGDIFPIAYGQHLDDILVKYTDLCWLKIVTEINESSHYIRFCNSVDGGETWKVVTSHNLAQQEYNLYLGFVYFSADLVRCGQVLPLPIILSDRYINDDPYTLRPYSMFRNSVYFTPEEYAASTDFSPVNDSFSLSLTASDVIAFPDVLEGQSVCVDVGMMTDATADQIADEIIDAAIDGTLSPSISAETWTVDVVATPQDLAQDLDIDLDTTTDIVDEPTVPDTPDDTVEFDTPEHYTVRDLSRFFPFCIPFDVIGLLGVLNADPVTPHFEYRFNPSFLNVDHTIVIDLGQFDTLAALLRRLETLGFCVGLAMVTRNLIRG